MKLSRTFWFTHTIYLKIPQHITFFIIDCYRTVTNTITEYSLFLRNKFEMLL